MHYCGGWGICIMLISSGLTVDVSIITPTPTLAAFYKIATVSICKYARQGSPPGRE